VRTAGRQVAARNGQVDRPTQTNCIVPVKHLAAAMGFPEKRGHVRALQSRDASVSHAWNIPAHERFKSD